MSYKIVSCKVSGPIEKIRGTEVAPVIVDCEYKVGAEIYKVSGIASFKDDLNSSIEEAIKDSENRLRKLLGQKANNPNLSALVREMADSKSKELAKKASRDEIEGLYQECDGVQQQKIDGLCEALGIDTILVEKSWTKVEALALINYLEKMTSTLIEEK